MELSQTRDSDSCAEYVFEMFEVICDTNNVEECMMLLLKGGSLCVMEVKKGRMNRKKRCGGDYTKKKIVKTFFHFFVFYYLFILFSILFCDLIRKRER